jgi:hypothetical protein
MRLEEKEKRKCNNHKRKKLESVYIVRKKMVIKEINYKNNKKCSKFYYLAGDILWKWETHLFKS